MQSKKLEVPFYVLLCIGITVYLKHETAALTIILGVISAVMLAIIRSSQIDNQQSLRQTQQVLSNQNVDLAEIKTHVNGGSTKLKEQHLVEYAGLDKRTTAEIHKRDGAIAVKDSYIKHLEDELTQYKVQIGVLTERLTNCLSEKKSKQE